MSLPNVMPFEKVRDHKTMSCYWRRIAFRKPKKGEWYVSGAIPMAYRAPNDLPTEYLVVVPTFFAKHVSIFQQGDPVLVGQRVQA